MDGSRIILAGVTAVLLLSMLSISTVSRADWFEKWPAPTEDSVYIRLDELTGSSSTTETFTANTSAEAYLKVLGVDSDPWMMPSSGWSLDLYMKPTVTSSWTPVASGVTDSFPSDRITVNAGVTAELKAVAYYPREFKATLSSSLPPTASNISCIDHEELPSQGVIDIEDEKIKYTGKTDNGLTGLTRGYRDTKAGHHPSGVSFELYRGNFEIPIVIAIDTGEDGGGGGGSMDPSRCHRMSITIAEGTPPIARFDYTCWYNKLNPVNASASYDPDGRIVSYQWDWTSDGTYDAEGMVANHTYTSVGTYNVTLKVTDNDGMTSTTTQTVAPAQMMPENNPGLLTPLIDWMLDDGFILPNVAWTLIGLFFVAVVIKGYKY